MLFIEAVDCGLPLPIENGRVIVVNESTIYGGSAEYHCLPNFNRIGQFLRKCLEDGKWSGEEPRCEVAANEAQESSGLGTGIAIGATIIVVLLIIIGLIFLHRNKARPVKNTENVQAAETKEDRNASVMSYATLDGRGRPELANPATFNTFHRPSHSRNRNINNNLRATGGFIAVAIFEVKLQSLLLRLSSFTSNDKDFYGIAWIYFFFLNLDI